MTDTIVIVTHVNQVSDLVVRVEKTELLSYRR